MTLRDAAPYINKLRKAEHDNPKWQAAMGVREPPKGKAQLREMLAEAVRNTQSEPKRRRLWQAAWEPH